MLTYRIQQKSVGIANRNFTAEIPLQPTTMNTTISFETNGTAHCLWTEAVPLHTIGRLEIHRASHIEFNNTTQQWEVRDLKKLVRFLSKSRAACLAWEQQNIERS